MYGPVDPFEGVFARFVFGVGAFFVGEIEGEGLVHSGRGNATGFGIVGVGVLGFTVFADEFIRIGGIPFVQAGFAHGGEVVDADGTVLAIFGPGGEFGHHGVDKVVVLIHEMSDLLFPAFEDGLRPGVATEVFAGVFDVEERHGYSCGISWSYFKYIEKNSLCLTKECVHLTTIKKS